MSGPRACVIGRPVAHSRSPLIHTYWLKTLGLSGSYVRRLVEPDALEAFVAELRAGTWAGCNVTIPHKEAMAALCDRLTPDAKRLGSVNTVWREGDTLIGDTTDGHGFLAALDQEAAGWDARRDCALVVGAGGAARPIVDTLKRRGFAQVAISSRTDARAERLAAAVGGHFVPFADFDGRLGDLDLLVNASPAGMDGQPPLQVDVASLPDHAVVDDIVYAPALTPLIAAARARGLRTVGGLGMLLHQAAPGFHRWFGVCPEVTPALRAHVEADIRSS